MLWMTLFSTVVGGIYPFLWVLVPAKLLSYLSTHQTQKILMLLLPTGALALLFSFLRSYLQGNYRMRMNKVRYFLIRDLIQKNLTMDYEKTLSIEELEKLERASTIVMDPTMGEDVIIVSVEKVIGNSRVLVLLQSKKIKQLACPLEFFENSKSVIISASAILFDLI